MGGHPAFIYYTIYIHTILAIKLHMANVQIITCNCINQTRIQVRHIHAYIYMNYTIHNV